MEIIRAKDSDSLTLSRQTVEAWGDRRAQIAGQIADLQTEADTIGEKLKAARVLMPSLFDTTSVHAKSVMQHVIDVIANAPAAMSPADIRAALIKLGVNTGSNPASLYTFIKRAADAGKIERTEEGYVIG